MGELKMNESHKIFQKRLRIIRELRGLQQKELAKLVDMPVSSISHFEIGSRRPAFDSLIQLANALKVSTDYLTGRIDYPIVAKYNKYQNNEFDHLTNFNKEYCRNLLSIMEEINSEIVRSSDKDL